MQLRSSNLKGANFNKAELYTTDLRDSNMQEADFAYANLTYISASNATFRYARLLKADLYKADLFKADMRDTDMGSMLRVKGQDGFCPVGPGLVSGVDQWILCGLIILVATIGTFILAVGAYVMFRVRESRGREKLPRRADSYAADVFGVTETGTFEQHRSVLQRRS